MWMLLYVFALVVGGVLLGASMFLGGDGDGDGHPDGGFADADADVDLEAGDADVGHDLGGHDHADHALGHGHHGDAHHPGVDAAGAGDALGFLLWSFGSLRFWTFFLAFFGLTGLALDGLGLVPAGVVGPSLAVGTGLLVAWSALFVLRRLSTGSSSSHATARDYVGKTARVLVPVAPEGVGKVRVRIGGQDVDLLATTDDPAGFRSSEEALVIEVDGTRARIARVDELSRR